MSDVYCVQDRTGTVAQLTLAEPALNPIEVNDTGTYEGVQPWSGRTVSFAFTVGQVLTALDFGITTALPNGAGPGVVLQSGWPPTGVVTWVTGANEGRSDSVVGMMPANAYITTDFLAQYVGSRGSFAYADSPIEPVQQAIVQATDYLDQRYRYQGVKLLQFLSNPDLDPFVAFIDPWLSPFGFTESAYFVPSTTQQETQWPRQGVVDWNGDTVFGVPLTVQKACAELAARVLNGVVLQPDYNATAFQNGAIVSSYTTDIAGIRESTTYDTKFGTGFFTDFPQVTRMLRVTGLLVASGGMTLVR